MAFPTAVNQPLTDTLRATPEHKAVELINRVRLIKDICAYISGESPIRARRLSDLQGSLYSHKAYMQSENLATAESRAAIAAAFPQYADAAAVTVDIQAANQAFSNLTDEIELVLSQFRASTLLQDNDPVTGEKIEPDVPEGDMTALRALASSVQAALG